MLRLSRLHNRLVLVTAGALLLAHAAAAQGRSTTAGRGWPERPPQLRARVHVLDAPILEALPANPQGRATLVFGATTPSLRRLSRGDVLVGGTSDRAPQGLLRRVTGVVRRKGDLVVETEPGSLEDVFWRAHAGASIEMRSADIASTTARVEGVRLPEPSAESWSPGPLRFELLDAVLLDLDGDPSTMGDQLRATGTLEVQPTFDFDLDMAWGRIQALRFTNTTRLSSTLELDGGVTAVGFDRTITVASVRFAPVTIFVGPVPLVFTPILDVEVGASGSVTTGIRSSFTVAAPVSAGVLYENGRWSGFADLPDGPDDIEVRWQPPELQADASITVFAGPQLAVSLYDLGGPFAAAYGYASIQAEVLPSRSWSLDVGLRGRVGLVVTVPITGEKTRYGLDVFNRSWRVASGEF